MVYDSKYNKFKIYKNKLKKEFDDFTILLCIN